MSLAALGLNPDRVRRLLAAHDDPDRVLRRLDALPTTTDVDRIDRAGATFVLAGDPQYPASLVGLPDAPPWLYVKGEPGGGPRVAIVGSR